MQAMTTNDVGTVQGIPLSEQAAQKVAANYVETLLGKAYAVVSGACYYSAPHERSLWRFFVRGKEGPVGIIYVNPETGRVLPWTTDEKQIIHEKAAILRTQKTGDLPCDEKGHVLREYARRQATVYLSAQVGLQAVATNPLFLPLTPPVWQCSIELGLPEHGTIGIFGTIDVDAHTGEVVPLSDNQIQQIWTRGNAALEFYTQTPAL